MGDQASAMLSGALAQVSPDDARPGVLGLVVVLGLIVATALLMVSFTRHLRRVDFEEQPSPAARAAADPSDSAETEPLDPPHSDGPEPDAR